MELLPSFHIDNTPPLINIKCCLACLNIVVTVVAFISTPFVQTCQPSRFWRDSPVFFLPDVPRPAKSWNVPLFVRSRIFFGVRAICRNAFISVGCSYRSILLTKSQCGPCKLSLFFAGKSRFFTRNVPLKTFSRLAGLLVLPGMCETPPTRGQERMYSNEQRIKGCLWHVDSNTTKPITRPAERLGEADTVRRTGAKYK